MFKVLGGVLGGSVLIVFATILPGCAIGLPLLGASGVLTWFGGIAGGGIGGAMGIGGGAILDERERRRADRLEKLLARLREYALSEAAALCIVKILVAAAICDAPMNALERKTTRDLAFASTQLFLSHDQRITLDSLLVSNVSWADAVEDYHRLAAFGEGVQRFTLELVNAVLTVDAESIEDAHLHPEEKAFRARWTKLTASTTGRAAKTEVSA